MTAAWLLLLLACQGSPTTSVLWRESWELLVPARDGSLVDARITVGNTGLLRGQAHLRADRWAPGEAPIVFGRDVAPVEVDVDAHRTAVRLGNEGLVRGSDLTAPETWTFSTRDNDANVLLHLTPADGLQPRPAAWQEGGGQWTVAVPVARGSVEGWFSAGDRGGLVQGWGVLLHRGGDGRPAPPRRTVVVAGLQASIGVDMHGAGRVAWAWVDGRELSVDDVQVELPLGAPGQLRFVGGEADGLLVDLQRQRRLKGARLPFEHLLGIEQRLVAWQGGWVERSVQRARARISFRGRTHTAPAAIVEVQQVPWEPSEARYGESAGAARTEAGDQPAARPPGAGP